MQPGDRILRQEMREQNHVRRRQKERCKGREESPKIETKVEAKQTLARAPRSFVDIYFQMLLKIMNMSKYFYVKVLKRTNCKCLMKNF